MVIGESSFKRENIFLLALALFLITLPISYGLNSVSCILIGGFFFTDTKTNILYKLNELKKNNLFILFSLFFLIQLVGLIYTEDFKRGTKLIQNFLPFIVLPLALLSEKVSALKIAKILYANCIYMFLLLAGLLTAQFIIYDNISRFEQQLFVELGISSFYFSAFIYLNIVTLLFHLRSRKFQNVFDIVLLLLFGYFLILLSARISLLIMSFTVMLFFIRFVKFKSNDVLKKIVLIPVLLFTIGLIAYQTPQIKKKIDITTRTMDFDFDTILTKNQISLTRNTLEYRILINYCSFQIFKNNIFGVGTGDNRIELQKQYKELNFRAGIVEDYNCHNQYFEEITKTGVLGFTSFILLLSYVFYVSLKEKRFLFYIIIYIALVCLTESYFYRHHGIMFGAFFIALFFKLESSKNTNKLYDTFLN